MVEEKSDPIKLKAELKLLHRRGFKAWIATDGSVRYVRGDKPHRKPPKFSREQLARAQASLDAGTKVGVVAAELGVATTITLRAWLKKYLEQPELWDHPQAPVGIPEDAVAPTEPVRSADAVEPAAPEPAGAAGGAGGHLPGL